MTKVFTRILKVDVPAAVQCNAFGKNLSFNISFNTNGTVPFPQVIIHTPDGRQYMINGEKIQEGASSSDECYYRYSTKIPDGALKPGTYNIQMEGCRIVNIQQSLAEDWIKEFRQLRITPNNNIRDVTHTNTGTTALKLYFGIHKHMHQPYYNATDKSYWDGEKDSIFGSRVGPYTNFIPNAVLQYCSLPHAGLSTSWSGSLIEQLNRCAAEELSGGRFNGWNKELRTVAQKQTIMGNPRVDFSAFGFFHPLMALIPGRDIIKQVKWHRRIISASFGIEASSVMFPPETAFHTRMIPALNQVGIKAVIYDSIHRFRSCRDYPYAGISEGMLPPNPAEQVNQPVNDWLQLRNVWAGSKISPMLLKPEYVQYEDPDGKVYKIIAVPAERYIGNEDARGGFGALQYPDVLGQVYDRIVETGTFDPQHPPFFLLHSDGDNYGGGADSYYNHNTRQLVQWLHGDQRFELTTIHDYLDRFPPDPTQSVHIEPGAWSGADNGDPQFMKWFSRYDQPYSPDLNSWAVLTAFQNIVHTLEDNYPGKQWMDSVNRLLLTAETSCYWYWTGQLNWDQQVTNAANAGYEETKIEVDRIIATGCDCTSPTIFPPWIIPENPGGSRWGQGCLIDAPSEGTVHTFIYDIAGIKRVTLVLRTSTSETRLAMTDNGLYPSQTGAVITANYYTAKLPIKAGDIRYYIEAVDTKGNMSCSSLERVHLA